MSFFLLLDYTKQLTNCWGGQRGRVDFSLTMNSAVCFCPAAQWKSSHQLLEFLPCCLISNSQWTFPAQLHHTQIQTGMQIICKYAKLRKCNHHRSVSLCFSGLCCLCNSFHEMFLLPDVWSAYHLNDLVFTGPNTTLPTFWETRHMTLV